jgi:hypothetical protein
MHIVQWESLREYYSHTVQWQNYQDLVEVQRRCKKRVSITARPVSQGSTALGLSTKTHAANAIYFVRLSRQPAILAEPRRTGLLGY